MVSPQPVLKWAGGKRQLLAVIDQELPKELKEGKIKQYFEPMLGGGAVFFHIKEKYGGMIESYHISDFNWDLFVLYRVIQSHVKELIKELESLASEYLPLPPTQQGEKEGERISMFEGIRKEYNSKKWIDIRYRTDGKTPRKRFSKEGVRRSALTIFLNRRKICRCNYGYNVTSTTSRLSYPLSTSNITGVKKVNIITTTTN